MGKVLKNIVHHINGLDSDSSCSDQNAFKYALQFAR